MAVIPKQINIAELDFDEILANLVEFMKEDPTFKDYDFAGSGLRMLARVLAYVTMYQNYYLSAAVNESFLDTAQTRSAVASHARMLGYTLRGTVSARLFANVAVTLSDTSPVSITLPKHTRFALIADPDYTFYNLQDVSLQKNANSVYFLSGLELVEGRPLTYRFTANLNDPTQRFIIPNANIDYSTISVSVQEANTNIIPYTPATSLITANGESTVFFVQETYGGYPEIKFGNDVVGKAIEHGNIVIATYFISKGTQGNNIRGPFRIEQANVTNFVSGVTHASANMTPSMGGIDYEALDSARFLAPLMYSAQNRCVTADDYKAVLLNSSFGSQVSAVNVFGGEQGDPDDPLNRPVFGRVYVAVKPTTGLTFTDVVRTEIENTVLRPRCVVGTIPRVINPDYIYLSIATSVRYDPNATTKTQNQLANAISNNITTFAQNSVEKFGTTFRFSRFVRVIDDADESIMSSLTRVALEKRLVPVLNQSNQFVIKFNAPLRKVSGQSVILEPTSHRFSYLVPGGEGADANGEIANCFFYEDSGNIKVAYWYNSTLKFLSTVGTINVTTGLATISSFIPCKIENNATHISLSVIPAVNDFSPRLNQLFTLGDIRIQLLNDAITTTADETTFFGGILP